MRFVARRRDLRTPTPGNIDEATFVDGEPGIVSPQFGCDVPRGAPFYVRGWAIDLGRRDIPWDVSVEVDGKAMPARIRRGVSRPDIVRLFGSAAVFSCGFAAFFETRALSVGPHELRVRAIVGRRGAAFAKIPSAKLFFVHDTYASSLSPRLHSADSTPWYGLDPIAEVPTGSLLVLTGWALDEDELPLLEVVAQIDDGVWSVGWTGIERNAQLAKREQRTLARAGFSVRIRLDTVDAGVHTLRLAGKTASGRWIMLGRRERLVVTLADQALSPWLRTLVAGGEALITRVAGDSAGGWLVHRIASGSDTVVEGVLRRSSPPGTPVKLVVRSDDGVEGVFSAWSAPTSDPNVLMFGVRIPARSLSVGRHRLFVDAPDLLGRSIGRAASGCNILVERAATGTRLSAIGPDR